MQHSFIKTVILNHRVNKTHSVAHASIEMYKDY